MLMLEKSYLTPKARPFYNFAKKMLNVARELDNENATNRQRLQKAVEASNIEAISDGKIITTLRFIQSQLMQQPKHKKGRRYTIDDKIFALSLMKLSRRSYRLLERIFAVPSRKTTKIAQQTSICMRP